MFDWRAARRPTRAPTSAASSTGLHRRDVLLGRHRSPLALLLFDLDHFKLVNDTHGHLAGDRVLAEFSGFVLESIRNEDVFARYGGEEFAILCRLIGASDAMRFADRLRRGVESLSIEHEGSRIPITASIGVACLPDLTVDTANELLLAADRALYQAKELGRNRASWPARCWRYRSRRSRLTGV
jgi:diguanylate cyclase (GGDEF)-like protein